MIDKKLTLDGLIHEFFPDGDICRELRFNHMMMEIAHKAVADFKKSLWHDAIEEPELAKLILCQRKTGYTHYMVDNRREKYQWDNMVYNLNIVKWCYIDDLLPKEGGEQ